MKYGTAAVERMIERYPELCTKKGYQRKSPKLTASYSKTAGVKSSNRSDPTADAVIYGESKLSIDDEAEYQTIKHVINQTQRYDNGRDRYKTICMLYWSNPRYSEEEIAEKSPYSVFDIRIFKNDFIRQVANYLGDSDCVGCVHWRELYPGYNVCLYCFDMGCIRKCESGICLSKSIDCAVLRKAWWWTEGNAATIAVERRLTDERKRREKLSMRRGEL
jgi:hypothetical protein